MKGLTEAQYSQLCLACDALLKENSASFERNANALLHVIREHPIFLNNYSVLFQKREFIFSIYLIKKLFWHVILGSYKLVHAIYRNYFFGDRLIKDKRVFENIFISHFLNDSFIDHKSDFYFFDLPQKIAGTKSSSLQLYINFTNQASTDVTNKWKKRPVVSKLLPRYLSIFQEIKIRSLLLKEAINILKSKTVSNFEKRLKYQAAVSSLSSATHSNYRLAVLVQQYIKNNGVKRVFTTYEGHPWERLIFAMAREIDSSVECIGYQHALVFRKQHAIRRKLDKNFEPDYILFSGKKGINNFKAINYLPSNRLILFGTNRIESINKTPLKVKSTNKNVFLMLPEGDLIECIPLTKFVLQLALKYSEFKFIIRFHPITKVNLVIRECPLLKKNLPNLEISKMSFEDDLRRSDFAIYRGSTTIIKAIQNGLVPLYYQKENEITIDPLFEIQEGKTNLSSIQDLSLVFNKPSDEIEKSQTKLIEHINDFFSPINYDEVLKYLNKQI